MPAFVHRRWNVTVLLLVVFAQLVLLAIQVKNERDILMIRSWTVTAVTPAARLLEFIRSGSATLVRKYFALRQADADNRRLQGEVDRLKLENLFLKNELNTADRAQALQIFQARSPSRTLAATVVGVGAGANSKVVFIDRGSASGIQRGMGAITPEGIAGKVIAVYPGASEVMLVTDPEFAAGVVSEKNQTHGTLKGQGAPLCKVDYVPLGRKMEVGERLYTSGDDRIFPRGLPAGVVTSVRDAQPYQEISMEPGGLGRGLEDLLIIVDGVHQAIPAEQPANQPVFVASPPPVGADEAAGGSSAPATAGTDADKLRALYQAAGQAQGHTFGEGPPGSKPPDFTKLGQPPAAGSAPAPASRGAAPPAPKPVSAPSAPAGPPAPKGPPAPAGRPGGPPPG